MSRGVATNCGLVDALQQSTWCGLSPCARRRRETVLGCTPACAAFCRVLQCIPQTGGATFKVASTSSASASGVMRFARPELGR